MLGRIYGYDCRSSHSVLGVVARRACGSAMGLSYLLWLVGRGANVGEENRSAPTTRSADAVPPLSGGSATIGSA